MRVVHYDDLPDQPWRNGRGTTREVFRDDRWRLSIATISEAGPFSAFPGTARTLVVARGSLELTVDGVGRRLRTGDIARFGGEQAVEARPEEPVTAVNVMTAPGFGARVGEWDGEPTDAVIDLETLDVALGADAGLRWAQAIGVGIS